MQLIFQNALSVGKAITMYSYFTILGSLIEAIAGFFREFGQIPQLTQRMEKIVGDIEDTDGLAVPTDWSILEAENICFAYDAGKNVLSDFSCRISQNALIHLKGDNGSGKTTFLKLLCGLYPPQAGSLTLQGRALSGYDQQAWRRQIAMMEQFPAVFPGRVFENVQIAALDASSEAVWSVLRKTSLAEIADRKLLGDSKELSGGELRRLSLARVLLRQSPILLLDEPFVHLDEKGRALVQQLIDDETATRLYITHERNEKIPSAGTI